MDWLLWTKFCSKKASIKEFLRGRELFTSFLNFVLKYLLQALRKMFPFRLFYVFKVPYGQLLSFSTLIPNIHHRYEIKSIKLFIIHVEKYGRYCPFHCFIIKKSKRKGKTNHQCTPTMEIRNCYYFSHSSYFFHISKILWVTLQTNKKAWNQYCKFL